MPRGNGESGQRPEVNNPPQSDQLAERGLGITLLTLSPRRDRHSGQGLDAVAPFAFAVGSDTRRRPENRGFGRLKVG